MSTVVYAGRALLPGGRVEQVRLLVDDGRFQVVAVGSEAQPGDTVLDGLILPGLANAHSHAFHRALRGRTHGGGGTFWTWREEMYRVAATLTPESYLDLARAVFAEMVLAGFTVVGEFHYVHHASSGEYYPDPDAMGEAIRTAAREAGIRLTLLDTLYLRGGLAREGHRELDEVQGRFNDVTVAGWAERLAGQRDEATIRHGAAIHSVRAVPFEQLVEAAAAVGDRVVHAHVSEQPAENDAALAHYGATPVALLDRAGLVGPRFTAVHATHLAPSDIDVLGVRGASACFCPTTEADLADGIGPATELRDAGVRLCLGSDQHAVVDPFADLQRLEGHDRLRSLQRGRLTPAQLLETATSAGYASLGWDGGRLESGALADLVVVDDASVRTVGSRPDQVPLTATAADVTDVIVGGERVVTDRQHRLGDVATLLGDALAPWKETP